MRVPAIAFLLASALIAPALAGSSTVNYNSTGSSPFRTTTDAGGTNNISQQTIWDSAAGANGLGITANNAAKVEGVGTAGTAAGGVQTVQGQAAMTPVLVNPGTVATWGIMGSTTPGTSPGATSIIGGIFNSTLPTATNGQTLPLQTDASGELLVNVGNAASTTGNIGANNTTAVVIKASAGTLYGAQLGNIGSVPAYLKIYNATTATCGSGTPVKRLIIPKAATAADGGGSNISFGPNGIAFSTGITYCLTGGITDADTTAPAASTVLVNLDWR